MGERTGKRNACARLNVYVRRDVWIGDRELGYSGAGQTCFAFNHAISGFGGGWGGRGG